QARLQQLRAAMDSPHTAAPAGAGGPTANTKRAGGLAAIGALVLSLLAKGKLLLLGLTKASTVLTMILSMGVYWSAYGWKFAVGLVISIYIHEMGHVAA